MRWLISVLLVSIGASALVGAQMHDHTASATGDGQFNPFVVSDNRGGFYVTYVERKSGVNNVMFQHSTIGNGFANGVRIRLVAVQSDHPGVYRSIETVAR
jgi:hypothetical protein